MAGRKFGIVMAAKVPGSYHALPKAEQEKPGEVFEELMGKYAGKVDVVRRYWTSAFTADATDVFIMECDDLMDAHNFNQDLTQALSRGGDPERFGYTVQIYAGINPDAG